MFTCVLIIFPLIISEIFEQWRATELEQQTNEKAKLLFQNWKQAEDFPDSAENLCIINELLSLKLAII